MKAKKKRVIPGFGLSMGVTITILSLVVLIPLAALVNAHERYYRNNYTSACSCKF